MDIWTTNKGVEWTRPDATPASIFFVAFLLNCGVRGTPTEPDGKPLPQDIRAENRSELDNRMVLY